MISLKPDFFKEEIRCGFTVCEEMKRAWAAEMEVLSEVIAVCKKYGLTYYADYGTLLGTVRHHGFVPWDDDIDIALKRKDFERLFHILPQELPAEYGINSYITSTDHHQPWGSVTNSQYITWDTERTEKFYGCPYVVGIDIYPLDYLPRDKEMAQAQIALYNAVYDGAQRYDELAASGELEQYIPQLEELCRVSFRRDQPLQDQLWRLSDRIAAMAVEDESDYLTLYTRIVLGDLDFKLKKEWYSDTVELPFECMKVAVPKNYREVLTVLYGDYETPVQGQSAHDYPFYNRQKEIFKSMGKM